MALSFSITLWHVQGAPSLSWETIEFPTHASYVFSTLFHSARVVELPVYEPDAGEQQDAQLYAQNVRRYMVRFPYFLLRYRAVCA